MKAIDPRFSLQGLGFSLQGLGSLRDPNSRSLRGAASLSLRGHGTSPRRTPERGRLLPLVASIAICLGSQVVSAQGLSGVPQRLREKAPVSFSKEVAGILNSRCGQCHVQGSKGDFRMSTFSELTRFQGAITAGNPAQSKLYTVVESGEMPPKASMPEEEKNVIKRWIEQGAKFDGSNENENLASMSGGGGSVGGPPAGYSNGGPPAGYSNGGPPAGYSNGGPPAGYSNGGPPAGYSNGGPPAGYSNGGPPAGYSNGGPPAGYSNGGPPAGYSNGGPPAGYSNGGPPAGYSNGGPPAGYSNGGPPAGGSDMSSGYGGYYSGPSGGRGSSPGSARGGVSRGDVMDTYASNLTSLVGSIDLSGLFFPEQEITTESGPVLKREAEQAFMAGNQPMALELMFGHMATEYEDASVELQTVKYSPLLKRPVWNIRWGVSMHVRGDDVTDPKPIREGATPVRRVASRGGRGQSYDGGYEDSMQDYGSQMDDYGDDMDMSMDDYGSEYGAQMQNQMRGRGGPGGRGGAGRPEAPKIPERTMLSDQVQATFDKTLGLVSTIVSEEFNKRFQQGDFGPIFATLAPAPAVEDNRGNARAPVVETPQSKMSAALNDALTDVGDPEHPMWHPGLVYLGDGTSDEMLAVAKRHNVDLVLHFDVILKSGRNDAVQNISRCRLLNVSPPPDSQGKLRHSVVASKGMDSNEAEQFAGAGRMDEREYVTEQLSGLFSIIDRDVKVVDLPALPPAVAQRRIAAIISGPGARSLRTLAEVRLYQVKNLINEAEVEAAFDIVGGSDGLVLLHGPKKDRIETARKWAIESVTGASPK